MGRKSSILKLPPEVRRAVDRAIRERGATIEEIVEMVDRMGSRVSKSALGRYAKNAREAMRRFQEARQVAEVWARKLSEDPESDVGRLVTDMLRTVAFQQVSELGEDSDNRAKETATLARALKDLSISDKYQADLIAKVRRELAAEAAKEAQRQGLSAEQSEAMYHKLLGVVA